jgi:hypothetical protein
MHMWIYVAVQVKCDVISQYITVVWRWFICSRGLSCDDVTDELGAIFHHMLLTGLKNEYLCEGFNAEMN